MLQPDTIAQLEQCATNADAARGRYLAMRDQWLAEVAELDAEILPLRAMHAEVRELREVIAALEAELIPITAPSNAQAPLFAHRAANLRQQIAAHRAKLEALSAQIDALPPLAFLKARRDRSADFAGSLDKAAQDMNEAAEWARQMIINDAPTE